ncbi:hypothetical protein [Profundibacter sp.]|uniref:hypothetical protein n=1 Tax=Profundibacter sp. TaxID=3101071 RepID=UPI003D1120D3
MLFRLQQQAIVVFVWLIGLMVPAYACPTAADLAATGTVPGAAILADCLELARFDIPTGRGVVQGSIYGTPETDLNNVREIEEALVRSGNTLQRFLALGTEPIDVFVSATPYISDDTASDTGATAARSVTTGPDNPPKCVISVFPQAESAQYKYTIAHEFFHCVQFSDFSHAEGQLGTAWWVEGTAEWFASMVYQGTPYSDDWVAGFDSDSATTPITEMEYETVVFFWWLSQTYGPDRVVDLMEAMPRSRGSQEDALARVLNDSEFLKFVKDYLERKITQPGGRSSVSTPLEGERYKIDSETEMVLEAPRFVTYRAHLEFACGGWTTKTYDLKGQYATIRQPEIEWKELPVDFRSNSEGAIRFLVAGAATTEPGFRIGLQARKTPCIPCQTPEYSDGPQACLIGEWHLASGGMGAKIGKMLQDSPALGMVDYPDLDGLLIFRPDGTFTLRADDNGSMETKTPSGGIFSAEISLRLEKEGTWSVEGDKLIQCYMPIKSIEIEQTVTTPEGLTEKIEANRYLGPPLSYTEKRQFTCTDNRLDIIQKAFLAPTIEWGYEK